MFDVKLSYKQQILVVTLVTLLGLILRLLFFDQVTFYYDSARDALEAISIWESDPIKIKGPTTDIPGLNHGPLYWYILSPFYFFSKGNVLVAKFFLMLINLSVIPLMYVVSKRMFKNTFVAISSMILYAVSFSAIQYAGWISNPAPAMLPLLLTMFSFFLISKKDLKGIALFLLSWPLSVHFQFFFVYQLFFFVALLMVYPPKLADIKKNIKMLSVALILSLGILGSFIVSEIHYNFVGVRSLFGDLGHHSLISKSFIDLIHVVVDRYTNDSYFHLGLPMLFSSLLSFVVIAKTLGKVFREGTGSELLIPLLWFLMPLTLFAFEKQTAIFLLQGASFGLILLFTWWLSRMTHVTRLKYQSLFAWSIIAIIAVLNINLTQKFGRDGQVMFTIQDKVLLADEQKVIEYIYVDANKKPFAIDTVTNPLFNNTTWAFLFRWYGSEKYGSMPVWLGYPQLDTFVYGKDIEFSDGAVGKGDHFYVIYEPPEGIPSHYFDAYPIYQDTRSKLVEVREIGTFRVEKRILTGENLIFSRDALVDMIQE